MGTISTPELAGSPARLKIDHSIIEAAASGPKEQHPNIPTRQAFPSVRTHSHVEQQRFEQAFNALDGMRKGYVSSMHLIDQLARSGLIVADDKRLAPSYEELKKLKGHERDVQLSLEQFQEIVSPCAVLITNALSGQLVIPSFEEFCQEIEALCEEIKTIDAGKVADYIPELADADPSQFGVSICTVDGQRFSWGTCDTSFCIQSCSKPISYMAACDELGSDYVHQHVGREPSGVGFNELVLKKVNPELNDRGATAIPHNPMVNSGAIMTSSLLLECNDKPMSSRFKDMLNLWGRLFGGTRAGFDNATYLSEKESAYRNMCLAYMMKESKSFPKGSKTPILDSLEFYFQLCSITATNDQMGIMAATLANGGICPLTNDQIFNSEEIRNCLTLMLSCGMYDYSGEWAFKVGLPAKAGVSGCVFIVIPNLMGISIFSPKLDGHGNSVRGVAFAERLLTKYALHLHDNLKGCSRGSKLRNLRARNREQGHRDAIELLFAASVGDLNGLHLLEARGVDFRKPDYDLRTPLHLAASEGHLDCVEYIVNVLLAATTGSPSTSEIQNCIHAKDRWGRTPIDDAIAGGHKDVVKYLKSLQD